MSREGAQKIDVQGRRSGSMGPSDADRVPVPGPGKESPIKRPATGDRHSSL